MHLRAATVVGLECALTHDKYSSVLTRLTPETLDPMGTPKDKAESPRGQTYISQLKLSTGTLININDPEARPNVSVTACVQEENEVQ